MAEESGKEGKEDYYSWLNVGSQNECTGMIPTVPLDEAQQEGYADLCPVPQQLGTAATKSENAAEQKRKSSRGVKKHDPVK
jgi:hypothetical protein